MANTQPPDYPLFSQIFVSGSSSFATISAKLPNYKSWVLLEYPVLPIKTVAFHVLHNRGWWSRDGIVFLRVCKSVCFIRWLGPAQLRGSTPVGCELVLFWGCWSQSLTCSESPFCCHQSTKPGYVGMWAFSFLWWENSEVVHAKSQILASLASLASDFILGPQQAVDRQLGKGSGCIPSWNHLLSRRLFSVRKLLQHCCWSKLLNVLLIEKVHEMPSPGASA